MSQWNKTAKSIGLNLKEWELIQDQPELLKEADGCLITYQGAGQKIRILNQGLSIWVGEKILSIADEAHHLGVNPDEPEGPVWGKTFLELTKACRLRMGLTGTPFRADNLAFCAARRIQIQAEGEIFEQISPDLCVEPRQLIKEGDVRPLEFRFQDGWVEHSQPGKPDIDISPLSKEHREAWRARNLRRAIRLSDTSSIASQLLIKSSRQLKKIRLQHSNAAGLVIARNIEHAKAIAHMLREDGDVVELIHSQDKDSRERLAAFQSSKAHWLVSVDMCSEGFDAPRIRVVAYLTTVVTRSRFLQGITRAVRMASDRTDLEPVPRHPSYVFAPADPLLMSYAKGWSITSPYLIKGNQIITTSENPSKFSQSPQLPMEAINDAAGKVINVKTAELPFFL